MIPKDKVIYLSGPMSNLPEHNYPAFHEAAAKLRSMGYTVISPAEGVEDTSLPWDYFMRRDIELLLKCQAVVVLPGYQKSSGATTEIALALKLGMKIYEFETMKEIALVLTLKVTGKRLPSYAVGDVALEVIKEYQRNGIGFGDLEELDEVAKRAGIEGRNPIERQRKVLNALDRDPRFTKSKIRIVDSMGRREVKARYFYPVDEQISS